MQQDPMTRVCYEVSTPEGTLHSDTFTLAKLHAEYAAKKHGRSTVVVEEITEIRRVMMLSTDAAKPVEAHHRRTGRGKKVELLWPKSEPIDSFLVAMQKRGASRHQPTHRVYANK